MTGASLRGVLREKFAREDRFVLIFRISLRATAHFAAMRGEGIEPTNVYTSGS